MTKTKKVLSDGIFCLTQPNFISHNDVFTLADEVWLTQIKYPYLLVSLSFSLSNAMSLKIEFLFLEC